MKSNLAQVGPGSASSTAWNKPVTSTPCCTVALTPRGSLGVRHHAARPPKRAPRNAQPEPERWPHPGHANLLDPSPRRASQLRRAPWLQTRSVKLPSPQRLCPLAPVQRAAATAPTGGNGAGPVVAAPERSRRRRRDRRHHCACCTCPVAVHATRRLWRSLATFGFTSSRRETHCTMERFDPFLVSWNKSSRQSER